MSLVLQPKDSLPTVIGIRLVSGYVYELSIPTRGEALNMAASLASKGTLNVPCGPSGKIEEIAVVYGDCWVTPKGSAKDDIPF